MLSFDMSIDNPIRLGMDEEEFERKFYHVLHDSTYYCGDDNPDELIGYFSVHDIDVFNLPKYLYEDLVKMYPKTFS